MQRHVARLHARFDSEKRLAEAHPEQDRSSAIARIASELAAAETRLQQLQDQIEQPISSRDLDRARHTKKATRAGMVAAGGLGSMSVLGTAVEQAATGQPLLLAFLGTAGAYGWYLVSRPFDAGQPAPAPSMETQQLAAPST
jgi:hypothetical protein